MGNDDSTMSILELRERQLIKANEIIARAQQLCERVLYAQGDEQDMSIVNLQYDCVGWIGIWDSNPVMGKRVNGAEADGVDSTGSPQVIPVDFNQNPEKN